MYISYQIIHIIMITGILVNCLYNDAYIYTCIHIMAFPFPVHCYNMDTVIIINNGPGYIKLVHKFQLRIL